MDGRSSLPSFLDFRFVSFLLPNSGMLQSQCSLNVPLVNVFARKRRSIGSLIANWGWLEVYDVISTSGIIFIRSLPPHTQSRLTFNPALSHSRTVTLNEVLWPLYIFKYLLSVVHLDVTPLLACSTSSPLTLPKQSTVVVQVRASKIQLLARASGTHFIHSAHSLADPIRKLGYIIMWRHNPQLRFFRYYWLLVLLLPLVDLCLRMNRRTLHFSC